MGRRPGKKYEWDIDPDDADHPTIHGLRGTGILARAEQGYDVDQIANDIGMSRQNAVLHALPRPDEGRRRRPKAASRCDPRGLDHERRPGYTSAATRQVCKTFGLECKIYGKPLLDQ
jgi:hypothetical protein